MARTAGEWRGQCLYGSVAMDPNQLLPRNDRLSRRGHLGMEARVEFMHFSLVLITNFVMSLSDTMPPRDHVDVDFRRLRKTDAVLSM